MNEIFIILRLIEEGLTFTELYDLGYEPKLLEHLFKVREYVLVSERRRQFYIHPRVENEAISPASSFPFMISGGQC